jgi:arylsulfatase A-like enzyme
VRSIRHLGAVALCAFVGLTGCGLDPVPWPPANANIERASHPSDETFRRKGWRDAVRIEGSETVRAFSLGPVGNAVALRLGLLREGRQHGMLTARVYVDNKVVKELPLLSRTSWAEYLVDLGPTAPEAECMVTFESPDAFWVAPLELVPAQSPKPNVLIVVLDTLRADHCSLYGYPRETTPSLDAFAKEAVVFDNMLATSSWTRPTIASLMTGAYPGRHGARTYTDVVRSDLPRIAAILNDNEYETYAFARNANVHPYWGLGNEFFSYAFFGVGASDDHVMQTLRHTLPKLKGSTWFAYVHLLDPHGPYTPREIRYGPHKGTDPAVYQEQFVGRMFSDDGRYMTFALEGIGVSRDRFIELRQEQGPDAAEPDPLPGLVRESIDLYDSEIYEADARFNEILNLLKDTGQFDDTLIVFLSDHGEEFFEHEGWTHGKTVYEEGVHVPFVIRMPGGEYAGRRVPSLVEIVDLPSTILSFLGLDVPETMQGRNLLPMIAGQEDLDHIGFASLFNEQGSITELSAAKWRHWKLIVDHVRKADAFYDLSVDPGELNPSATPPENGPAMRDRVSALRFRMADGLHLVFTSPIEVGKICNRMTSPTSTKAKSPFRAWAKSPCNTPINSTPSNELATPSPSASK